MTFDVIFLAFAEGKALRIVVQQAYGE